VSYSSYQLEYLRRLLKIQSEHRPQVDSPSILFVRIPDEAAVGLFCAAVGCYAHCADWMLAAYPSVSAGARGGRPRYRIPMLYVESA
jgi:hypothetical protein